MGFSTLFLILTIVLQRPLCYYNTEKIPVFESEVQHVQSPVLNVSIEDILGVFQKVMEAFKKVMEWLGILVLPEEDGSDGYVYPNETKPDLSDIAVGA